MMRSLFSIFLVLSSWILFGCSDNTKSSTESLVGQSINKEVEPFTPFKWNDDIISLQNKAKSFGEYTLQCHDSYDFKNFDNLTQQEFKKFIFSHQNESTNYYGYIDEKNIEKVYTDNIWCDIRIPNVSISGIFYDLSLRYQAIPGASLSYPSNSILGEEAIKYPFALNYIDLQLSSGQNGTPQQHSQVLNLFFDKYGKNNFKKTGDYSYVYTDTLRKKIEITSGNYTTEIKYSQDDFLNFTQNDHETKYKQSQTKDKKTSI